MTHVSFEAPVLQRIKCRVYAQSPGLVEDVGLDNALRLRRDESPCGKLHTAYLAPTPVAAFTCRAAALWILDDT